MFKTTAKNKERSLLVLGFCVLLAFGPPRRICPCAESAEKAKDADASSGAWDPARYIGLDEIKPGMEGYCLTEYGIEGIEKFNLKVIDVVRDFEPGRDVILVQGTDDRFIHSGPVGGCSGSPVYLDGRLAGALAFAWTYSKDPLYGATAIADMLRVGEGKADGPPVGAPAFAFDYSKPIDLAEIDRQITTPRFSSRSRLGPPGRINALPCPLITSGLPVEVCEQLNTAVKGFGFMVVPGIGGPPRRVQASEGAAGAGDVERKLVPGACLAVPLISGDMTAAVYGTVTEVRDGKVYGFGHPFQGYGAIDLPMATGKVHTVITSMARSTKLASVVETVGALTYDEGAGVLGVVGAEAQTFGLTVRVDRYNDEKREYNCRVASNRLLTPSLLRSVISGAALYLGNLPLDHTIEYKVSIGIKGFEPITFENVSTGLGVLQMAAETSGSIALLMNNPYGDVAVESMEFDIRIVPKDITSHIWSADVSDTKVKAGEKIGIDVVIESVRT
ncbi:MAG: hypothetical protein ISS79_07640, partial [Phycisphaerae bacterium]|nr:hypothetical protein [Phycisphaerae bacterium]